MLVAISGATGVDLAIKLLEILKEKNVGLELIISKNALKYFAFE